MAKTETEERKLEPKVDIEDVGPCKIKVRVEISADIVKQRIDEKYKDLNNSVSLPGFRKGKAPRNLLERKFGEAMLEDLKGELLSSSFDEVREDKKLEPLGEPDIDTEKLAVKAGEAFVYEMQLEIKPTIELKDYKKLKVERAVVEVKGEDIDQVIEGFRDSKAELISAKDGVKTEDQIIGDVVFQVGDKEIDKSENTTLVVHDGLAFQGVPLKDFEKALLKKKAGDDVVYKFDLPEDFANKEIAGKKGELRIAIKSVKRKQLPEVNEEFAKAFDMDSVEELREHVSKRVKKEKEAAARSHMADHLVDQIIESHNIQLPDGLIESSTDEALQRLRLQLTMQGRQGEDVEQEIAKHREESKDEMVKSLKSHFLLDEIAKKERIFVTEDQVEERVNALAAQQGQWPHEMKAYLEQQGLMTQLRRQMREEAVRDFLLDKAEIVEPKKGVEKKAKDKGD